MAGAENVPGRIEDFYTLAARTTIVYGNTVAITRLSVNWSAVIVLPRLGR
jgi:hypothetical protein